MTLSEVFQENNSFDVTLVSDEQIAFQAHKVVLSACSPVLKTLLLNNPHAHPSIYLRGVKQQELNSILQFMYLGEANIDQDSINKFMENARDLEVKYLVHDAQSVSENKMNSQEDQIIRTPEITQEEEVIDVTVIKDEEEALKNYEHSIQDFDEKVVKTYSCDKCDYQANYKELIKRHQLNKHDGVSFSCDECNVKYTCKAIIKT